MSGIQGPQNSPVVRLCFYDSRTEEHCLAIFLPFNIFFHIKGLLCIMIIGLDWIFNPYRQLKGVLIQCRVSSQQQLAEDVSACIRHDSEENMKYLNIWNIVNNTWATLKGHRRCVSPHSFTAVSLFPSLPRRNRSAQ